MSKVVYDKWLVRMGIAIFSLYVIILVVGDVLGTRHIKAMAFAGVVDSVTYDIKDYPTVVINNEKFLLVDPSWGLGYKTVSKGDSIVKQQGTRIIRLYKKDGTTLIQGVK